MSNNNSTTVFSYPNNMGSKSFIRNMDNIINPTSKQVYNFYQLCAFVNPDTDRYDCRQVIVDNLTNVVNIKEYSLMQEECAVLLSNVKSNEYKIYQTININYVDLPDTQDILILVSPLLK